MRLENGSKPGKEILIYLLLSCISAVQSMIALTLSLFQVRHLEIGTRPNLPLHLFGTVLLLLFILTLIIFIGKPFIVCFIISLFGTLIAIVNYYEILFHGTVLTHQDIRNISTAMRQVGNYTFQITKTVMFIIVSFFIMIVLLLAISRRIKPRKIKRAFGFIPLGLLVFLTWIMIFSPFAIVTNGGWSWELKYFTDSFVVGTIENIKRTVKPVSKPDGYETASFENVERLEKTAQDYPDIVVILNETYYNLDHISDFDADVSYMENYNKLKAFKGYAAVPIVGGGTNASEYELLTSNAITLLNTTTPFNDLSFVNSESLVAYLKSLGYATIAAHSERPSNYHRGTAWRELGFDNMYFLQDFKNLDHYGDRWNPSDASTFQNLQRFYEAMPDDKPRFAYLLTIQNHGDWNSNSSDYDLVHIRNSQEVSEYDCQRLNEYLTCIKQTDQAIREIIDYFSNVDRRVIVYMVGDHCPSFLSNIVTETSMEAQLKKRQVPYFIWNNYGEEYDMLPENHQIDICALTPYALKCAGLPLSPYYYQLYTISEKVQCLTGITSDFGKEPDISYLLEDGSVRSIYDETMISNLVRDYFYMEYNSLQGNPRIEALFDPEQG